jgi:predicted transposase YdaD
VKVININHGHNATIMAECEALRGYAIFVAKVREFLGNARGLTDAERKSALSRAIREAIAYCLDHDILAEYLKRHSGEVLNMFTMEFDINVAEQVWKEEALEKGREMGRAEGRQEGRAEGRQEGRAEGQIEILELMNQVESMEDFMRLRERLNTSGSTRSIQS